MRSFQVDILNESDSPPVFRGALTATVREDIAQGEEVLQVEAVDGDENVDRPIRYTLISSESPFDTCSLSVNV